MYATKALADLSQIVAASEVTHRLSKVRTRPPLPQPSFKRGRHASQEDLVFVSNVVFITPNATPPLEGRPYLFLKRNVNLGNSPASLRQRLEEPVSQLPSLPMMLQQAAEAETARPLFDAIPDDVVLRVLDFLPITSIINFACTCKRFRDLVRSSDVWEAAYARNRLHFELLQSNSAPIDHRRACLESAAVWKSWQQRNYRVFAVENAHTSRVNALLFADKGQCLISGGSDRIVKIWKKCGSSGCQTAAFSCINTFSGVKAGVVGMSVTDRLIFAGYRNGQVRIWDALDWKLLFGHQPVHKTEGFLFIHPQMVSWDEEIRVWDEETATPILTLVGHARKVVGIAEYTPETLVSNSLDRTIRVWDKRTATCCTNVRGLTNSASGLGLFLQHNLATCSSDGSIHIWDMRRLAAGPQLILREHRGPVRCVKYGFGRLLSGSDDSTVRIWNTDTYRCQQVFSEELAPISCIDLSSNAFCVGTASGLFKVFEFPPFGSH